MNPFLILELANVVLIWIAVLIIFFAIFLNLKNSQTNDKVKKEKKSIVETGSMIGFFVVFYLVIKFRLGVLGYNNLSLRIPLIILCWIVIAIGVYFNVAGRLALGKNWANQVRIYKNQTLVSNGVYRIVRHPLYASLIWMFYAASLIYLNYLAFLLNTFIFVPFMYYRAKQEEGLLEKQFKNYKEYKKSVGMFFPKFPKK
jgi:protein-S-isoprenylcysteine O-methyltransferase Ste14